MSTTTTAATNLLETDCSFAEVDDALHHTAPQIAQLLDAMPERKAMLAQFFDQPADKRHLTLSRFLDQHPEYCYRSASPAAEQRVAHLQRALADVTAACHRHQAQ